MSLAERVLRAAERWPDRVAVRAADGQLTYAELSRLADEGASALLELGVRRGDRVGILLEKGARAVAAMQAALRVGAAYVPLDVLAPPARTRTILDDGGIRVVFSSQRHAAELDTRGIAFVSTDGGLPGVDARAPRASAAPRVAAAPDELAYVLYTSGSTGTPKGVCLSHRNALAFVDWAVEALGLQPDDRLANHAPFFFDLSVLDLYGAFSVGAAVSIIPEGAAYDPRRLVAQLVADRLSVWYSVPSALTLMMDHGGLLEAELALRTIVFAGEPFPVKQLRRLRDGLPGVRLHNFYGPTETNVCTAYEVVDLDPARTEPVPIGRPCSGDRAWLAPLDPALVPSQAQDSPHPVGELIVDGPTVMLGYWGAPPHRGPYATGDVVRELPDGSFEYLGRRDSMVKVRGFRVELGEIEATLTAHPQVEQAAVVVAGSGLEARLVAFLVCPEPLGLVKLKLHCADRLPKYMIIDEARRVDALPRTRNGKVDRAALLRQLRSEEVA